MIARGAWIERKENLATTTAIAIAIALAARTSTLKKIFFLVVKSDRL